MEFRSITGLAVSTRNTIILHYRDGGEKHTDITGDTGFSALKYYDLYLLTKADTEI